MARKHELVSLADKGYPNIKEGIGKDGKTKEYYANFMESGRAYRDKHLTKLFPEVTSPSKAVKKLAWIREEIRKGNDPFAKPVNVGKSNASMETLGELIDQHYGKPARGTGLYNSLSSYRKNMSKYLDHVPVASLTDDIVRDAFKSVIADLEKQKRKPDNVITNCKKILRPIFEIAEEAGKIQKNFLDVRSIKKLTAFNQHGEKSSLEYRLEEGGLESYINVARRIYQAIEKFQRQREAKTTDETIQRAMYFALLTARRNTEVIRLRYEDITSQGTVRVTAGVTKTGTGDQIVEEYPLPDELLSWLDSDGTGKVFKGLTYERFGKHFNKLLKELDLPRFGTQKVTGHDRRYLFSSIMSKVTGNDLMIDAMLSHAKSVQRTYRRYDLEDRKKVFNQYWRILRGEETKRVRV